MQANSKKVKNNNKKVKQRRRRVLRKRLPNNRTKRVNVIRGNKIAAASAKSFKKRFTVLRQNGNSVRVTGRDLIYTIPDDLTAPIQDTNVITVIPANPAYWKGTRVSALASGYQNYRPLLFKLTYVPMCAVTQPGNVIGGTIWDDGLDNDNLQQSLRTSNGGFLTQCYVPHTTQIRPKTNLQFNLYRLGGEFSTTSNPFIFVALAIGCKNSSNQRVVPGYFYVTWAFELKNPIGNVNTYNNSGLILYKNIEPALNNTIINIDPNSEVPFGAYIDMEEAETDGYVTLYNGTPVEINENTPVWAFTSVTKTTTTKSITKQPIIYTALTTSTIILNSTDAFGYITQDDENYYIYMSPPITPTYEFRIANEDTVFLIGDPHQNFGITQDDTSKLVQVYHNGQATEINNKLFDAYKASKSQYIITMNNRIKKQENKTAKVRFAKIDKIPEPILNFEPKQEEKQEEIESDSDDQQLQQQPEKDIKEPHVKKNQIKKLKTNN